MLLALESMWTGPPGPPTPFNVVVTATATPWLSQAQTQNLWLYAQNTAGSQVALTAPVVLTLRQPDQTLLNITALNPGIGTYQVTTSASQSGLYRYTWYVNFIAVFSGNFYAAEVSAP